MKKQGLEVHECDPAAGETGTGGSRVLPGQSAKRNQHTFGFNEKPRLANKESIEKRLLMLPSGTSGDTYVYACVHIP